MMTKSLSTIRYYDNKEEHGPIYNWREVFADYKRLKVPDEYYDPTKTPVDKCHVNNIISIRSRGKTTGWLLIGMLAYKRWGCKTVYIRQLEDMLAPVNARELFDVINTYKQGWYVRAVSDEEYNYILVKDRRAYFARINENGEIEKRETEPWLYMVSVDRNYLYKSSFNVPDANLIIYDEFISNKFAPNEFVQYNDLLSTIIRKRLTPIIVMLANNINVNSEYFREEEISREVKKMNQGDAKICYTTKGMPIYVEIDKPKKQERHLGLLRNLFFGYDNPKLTSITGDSGAWVFEMYPHIVHEEDEERLARNLYIDTGEDLLNVEFVLQPKLGLVAHVHLGLRTYDDSVILTVGDITDNRQQFGYGRVRLAAALWELYKVNRVYYADNETGTLFKQYVNMCKISKK